MYTFGGLKSKVGYQLADIERLNARHFTQGRTRNNVWELLKLTSSDGNILTRRENSIMISITDREILILGGDGESGFKSDAYLLDTQQNSLSRVTSDFGFKLSTWSNQCC